MFSSNHQVSSTMMCIKYLEIYRNKVVTTVRMCISATSMLRLDLYVSNDTSRKFEKFKGPTCTIRKL